MKIYELFENNDFDEGDPLRVATAATLAQIKSDISDAAYKGEFTVNALLNKLRNNGVNIARDQLPDLVSEEPWSNLISNIEGNRVIFKSDSEDDSNIDDGPEDSENTMKMMADRAVKRPKEM